MKSIFRRTMMVFILLIAVAGCGTHRLHQAQEAYNAAALVEAEVAFEDVEATGDPLKGGPQALQGYRVALAITDEALDAYAEDLKADHLYGTALMLKALCQWRIAALDLQTDASGVRAMVAAIEHLVAEGNVELGTRDRVLLKALPGLHEHDLGLQQTDPEKAGRLYKSALATLEMALDQVKPPPDHPVNAYIRLSQMKTMRAWRWSAYPNRPRDVDALMAWNKAWNRDYEKYRRSLEPLMAANPGLQRQVKKMDEDFGYHP